MAESEELVKESYRDLLVAKQNGYVVDDFELFMWRREEELIRSAMSFPAHYRDCRIEPAHFKAPVHAVAWQAMQQLLVKSGAIEIDPAALLSAMRTLDSSLAGPKGANWLRGMRAEDPVDPEMAMDQLVKDILHYHRLRIWSATQQKVFSRLGTDTDIDALQADIVSIARDFVYEVEGEGRVQQPMDEYQWDPSDANKVSVVKTGFGPIDSAAGGGHGRGELMVWGGPTSGGKSYAMQRLVRNQAQLGNRVLYISCEDPLELMYCRMLADFCEPFVAPKDIRLRQADPETVHAAMKRMKDEFKGNVTSLCMVKPTVTEVCAAIRYYRYTRHIDMVIVDYIQAVSDDERSSDKVRAMACIVSGLKKCFAECRVAGVVTTQYARAEYRDGNEPSINAAKYCGDIENESEVIVFMWKTADGNLCVKLPKVKWSAAQNLRYEIKVNKTTGCHGKWEMLPE